MGSCHDKKAVVCVAQLVAALVTVHGLLSFLSDVYGLLDPSGKTLWLSVDHCSLGPANDMVLLSYDRFLDTASSRRVKNRKN